MNRGAICVSLALVLACPVLGWPVSGIVPASLVASDVRFAEHMLTAELYVGSPAERRELEVRFDVADVHVFVDQTKHSATFDLGTSTDVVYFGGTMRRTIVRDARYSLGQLSTPLRCQHCVGVLGLREDSMVWQWFRAMSFTPAALTMGARSPAIRDPTLAPVVTGTGAGSSWRVPCQFSNFSDVLCETRVSWNGQIFKAVFVPHLPHIGIPTQIYSAYVIGKSVYDTPHSVWSASPLQFEFVDAERADGGEPGKPVVSFDDETLRGYHNIDAMELLIEEDFDYGGAVVFGTPILSKVMLHRLADHTAIDLQLHDLREQLAALNAVLAGVTFMLLLRFKLTRVQPTSVKMSQTTISANALIRVLAWGVAAASLLLAESRSILSENPVLGLVVKIAIYSAIVVDGISWGLSLRLRDYGFVALGRLWHETLLTICLWVLIAPRRTEVVSSIALLLVAGIGIYTPSLYFSLSLPLFFTGRRRWTVALVWASCAVVAGGFGFAFVQLVALPLFQNNAAVYSDLVVPTTYFLLFLFVAGSGVSGYFYLRSAILRALPEKKSGLDNTNQEDKQLKQHVGTQRRIR